MSPVLQNVIVFLPYAYVIPEGNVRLIALCMHCLSVCHTGGSVKNGWG